MSTPFLREQAQRRAQAVYSQQRHVDDDDDDDDEDSAFGRLRRRQSSVPDNHDDRTSTAATILSHNSDSPTLSPFQYSHHDTPHPYPAQQQQQQHFLQQQQQQHRYYTTSNNFSSNNSVNDRIIYESSTTRTSNGNDAVVDLAASARKIWRHHGTGVTQALEDARRQSITGGADGSSSIMTVSIIAAVERVDSARQPYTAYVIRVDIFMTMPPQQAPHSAGNGKGISSHRREVYTEHRYSEFAKLHQQIVASSSNLSCSLLKDMPVFPKRSPFGRVGNWTPSQMFAPRQHEELIQYRKVQLDAWLVYLVAVAAAAGEESFLMSMECQAAVYDFILQPTPLPCHRPATPEKTTAAITTSRMLSLPNDVNSSTTSGSQPPLPPRVQQAASSFWQWNNPFSFTLGSGIRQACRTVQLMCGLSSSSSSNNINMNGNMGLPTTSMTLQESDRSIPIDLLRAARGLMFMTVVKGGLVISGRLGTGLVIARRDTTSSSDADDECCGCEWSAPCAVGTLGMGWGALAGADVTHFLVVLTTDQAVADLVSGGGHKNAGSRSSGNSSVVQLGAELSVAVGPIGRGANSHLQTGDWTLHPAYAYAHSQGLFVGMSIEGSVITVRHDVNAKFYGRSDFASNGNSNNNYARTEILQNMPPPKAAEPLSQVLNQAMQVEIRKGSFRPSQLLWSQAGMSNNDSDYSLNSPATLTYHHHSGSGSSSDSFGYNNTVTPARTLIAGNGHSSSMGHTSNSVTVNPTKNTNNRQQQAQPQQHQYLHPHHHHQFLYPKENQHHYHQN